MGYGPLTKDILEELYINRGMSQLEIAKNFAYAGVKRADVSYAMKKFEVLARTKSLANIKKSGMLGKKFGSLLVIKAIPDYLNKRRNFKWKCLCDCGKEVYFPSRVLKSRKAKRCVCNKEEWRGPNHPSWKGGTYVASSMLVRYKSHAKRRKINFYLNVKYLDDLFIKQDCKCALTGLPLTFSYGSQTQKNSTASLDRIDSTLDYCEGNVQWVHKCANMMKWDMATEEFVNMCRLVVNKYDKKF